MEHLRALAQAAEQMPWEKSLAEVPLDARRALADACTGVVILRLLDVVDKAKALVAACDVVNTSPSGYVTGKESTAVTDADSALRAALDGLDKETGK